MNKKVFVTGAAGFVGRNILPELLKQKYEVIALVKNESEKKLIDKHKTKIIVADLATDDNWHKHLTKNTTIIHLAAEIASKDPNEFIKNNVLATKNLVTVAKQKKVNRIIHFSSAAVTSIRLDDYAKTKKKQEELITKSKLPYFVLRPSMMYGPSDDKNVGWLIKMCKNLPLIPLPGGGNFGRQPIYIGDIQQIVVKLLNKKDKSKIFEIHGYEYVTLKQMIVEIKKSFKIKRVTVSIPISFLKLAIQTQQVIFSNPKFTTDQIESLTSGEKFHGDDWAKLFGIIPTKFSQGVEKMTK